MIVLRWRGGMRRQMSQAVSTSPTGPARRKARNPATALSLALSGRGRARHRRCRSRGRARHRRCRARHRRCHDRDRCLRRRSPSPRRSPDPGRCPGPGPGPSCPSGVTSASCGACRCSRRSARTEEAVEEEEAAAAAVVVVVEAAAEEVAEAAAGPAAWACSARCRPASHRSERSQGGQRVSRGRAPSRSEKRRSRCGLQRVGRCAGKAGRAAVQSRSSHPNRVRPRPASGPTSGYPLRRRGPVA